MDLIDKEHVTRFECGQDRSDVALALQGRTGNRVNPAVHLGRDNKREAGLTQPGRPGEQDVVTRLTTTTSSGDECLQLADCVFLANEVTQSLRTQRAVVLLILRLFLSRNQTCVVGHGRPPESAASPALTRSPVEPSHPTRAASASITE